jgi:hypothetical protein
MATLAKTFHHEHSGVKSMSLTERYNHFIEHLKFSHFGLISMTILIGSILGAIASMYVFQSGAPFWQFIVCLYAAMANLVASIAQAPTKWVLNIFVVSTAINTFFILIHVF